MDQLIKKETQNLQKTWKDNDGNTMEQYLVTGYENPRINMQSILTRHFFTRELFGEKYSSLMEEEIRFGIEIHKALLTEEVRLLGEGDRGQGIPRHRFWRRLEDAVPRERWDTFMNRWREILSREEPGKGLKVLELACGSANDYRCMEAYGLARFLDYTGMDITETNILNARRMFPAACFRVGNAMAVDAADGAFDYVLVSDLLEHLSPHGMETAAAEMCRVAGKKLLVNFFSMQELTRHKINPVKLYHWNWLSRQKTVELFSRWCEPLQVYRVREFLEERYIFPYYYNRNAHTFVLRKK